MIRSIDAAAVTVRMDKLLAKPPREMRRLLNDWAKRHGVPLG
jgi:phosphotransferase system enzyme I (PtsP)